MTKKQKKVLIRIIVAAILLVILHFVPLEGLWLGLLYLAIFGSVIAFVLYFSLARSRGFTLASYIGALTPLIAMGVSVVFEDARFGWPAALGLALVIAGQVLIVRAPKA